MNNWIMSALKLKTENQLYIHSEADIASYFHIIGVVRRGADFSFPIILLFYVYVCPPTRAIVVQVPEVNHGA